MAVDVPKVFVSYAHESDEHNARALAFATFLRKAGVEAILDLWSTDARQDWYAWAIREMTDSDFVLVVASERYRATGDGNGPNTENRGIQSEAALLRELVYTDRATWLPKVLPVLLPGHTTDHIPLFLQPHTASHFSVASFDTGGAEQLLRVILRQPGYIAPEVNTEQPLLPPHADGATQHTPDQEPGPRLGAGDNVVSGKVYGSLVQAREIRGDVVMHHHDHRYDLSFAVPDMASLSPPASMGPRPRLLNVFLGRKKELARLKAAALGAERVVAVHGLGGVGKSTLAAKFVELHADLFSHVCWVMADSPAALEDGLAALAEELAPETAGLSLEQRVRLGVRWLATHTDWLLVLDNLTGLADATWLLERVRTGMILITSRQATNWRGITTVPLNVLAPKLAKKLLAQTVHLEWPDADLAGAQRLGEELGWLPLAIAQAGAYIAQTRLSPAAYLDRLGRFPARMFDKAAEGSDAHRTMARIWRVTLDRLADTPLAAMLLRELAWYASENIPRDLITTADRASDPDVLDALGRLAAYHLITLTADKIMVHRLVQAVTRTADLEDPHRQPDDIATAHDTVVTTLTNVLSGHDPDAPASWPVFDMVWPHARVVFDHSEPRSDTADAVILFNQIGVHLSDQGNATTAVAYLTRAVNSCRNLYGADHPDTATLLNNLATAHISAGVLDQALPLLQSAFEIRERILGTDHRSTTTSRSNLASAYAIAGDHARALLWYQSTLEARKRVLGPDHPDTLTSRNLLACTHQALGALDQAIAQLRETLDTCERVLGPTHRVTLSTRNNLAVAYDDAGNLDSAIDLYTTTLGISERVLGSDHRETLMVRNNLAHSYEARGDLDKAIELYRTTLAVQERVLSSRHPDILMSRNNLAKAYSSAGDVDRAIPLFEETFSDCVDVLGPEHPDTLLVHGNLARAYEAAGELSQALPRYRQVLDISVRVLGSDHPDTLVSRNNLASAYQNTGDLEQAIRLYKISLQDAERVLSPDHPLTLTLLNNLAVAYWHAGSFDHAVPLFKETHDARTRVLGSDHPATLLSRNNLARSYEMSGDLTQAISMFVSALKDCERVLGPDHPLTNKVRQSLRRAGGNNLHSGMHHED